MNAARELAQLLVSWRQIPGGSNVYGVRDLNEQTSDQWLKQVHAAQLLAEVVRILTAMADSGADVDHFVEYIPEWSRAVIVPDRHWGQGTSTASAEELYPAGTVAMLKALADVVDASGLIVTLAPETKQTSLSAIDEIMELLGSMRVPLSGPERTYLFELLNSCRTVFQEARTFGSVDLLRRVHELLGVLTMLASSLTDDDDPEKKGLAERLMDAAHRVVPYVKFGAKVGAGVLGATADLGQIESSF